MPKNNDLPPLPRRCLPRIPRRNKHTKSKTVNISSTSSSTSTNATKHSPQEENKVWQSEALRPLHLLRDGPTTTFRQRKMPRIVPTTGLPREAEVLPTTIAPRFVVAGAGMDWKSWHWWTTTVIGRLMTHVFVVPPRRTGTAAKLGKIQSRGHGHYLETLCRVGTPRRSGTRCKVRD